MVQSLDRSQGRSGVSAAAASDTPATFTGNRALQIEERLIFEQGQPGRTGVDLPELPMPGPLKVEDRLNGLRRIGEIGLPGLSEPQVVQHYTRLSQKNYAIDMGVYPLGSCTMKHNPRINEKVARLPGIGDLHPLQPVSTVQGALELIDQLAHWLKTLTGMPAVAMSPAAGAHGEMCGMMAIAAAREARGERKQRTVVLAPGAVADGNGVLQPRNPVGSCKGLNQWTLLQLGGAHHPGAAPYDTPVLEDGQGGYALYLIGLCRSRVAVHIHLDHRGTIAHKPFELIEDRRHHPTRAAPFGEEIDQYRFVTSDQVLEGLGGIHG